VRDVKRRFDKKELERIDSLPLKEVADLAKSSIQTMINEEGEDEWGNKRVDGPVIACSITAKNGLNCFDAGL
jgi:hypothetical protein